MGPKIEAAIRFVTETGCPAAIGRLEDAELLLEGNAGTFVDPRGHGISFAREARDK
jgi:carbamate kinase